MKFARAAATAAIGVALASGSTAVATAAPTNSEPANFSWSATHVSPHAKKACHFKVKETTYHRGWTAGHSWAWEKIVGRGSYGSRVKEVQCLTRRQGDRPGPIDGIYGSRTEAAVKRAQRKCSIPDDGVVGPQTWFCLRWIAFPKSNL